MSSILKALRKLEEEKAALGEDRVDIARDILKRSTRTKERQLFWPLTSTILFLLLVGSGTYFWSANLNITTAPPAQPTDAVINKPVAEDESPIPPVAKEIISQTNASDRVVPPVQKEIVEYPQKPVSRSQPDTPAALSPSGLPSLKLSGIAYRVNAAERIAIINDLPVMQGTMIEGTTVVEIFPDRVILSWQGQSFEQMLENKK